MAALEIFQNHSELMGEVCIFPFEATQSSAIGRDPSKFGLIPEADTGILGQAQYANNRLSWSDPAMTADERQRALNQYLRFAASHNRKVLHSKNCSLTPFHELSLSQLRLILLFSTFIQDPNMAQSLMQLRA
ncbi:hypothetical protein [Candidatus Aalborgicola defluviihabitans]|uniref:hypothetical protein n=1 Tax=Candidatus Aalborgicola defluviihabitans TaxID=3386187 RepID=UPI00390B42BF|nr:hypothetical protein [Burkholderiales bacterium]